MFVPSRVLCPIWILVSLLVIPSLSANSLLDDYKSKRDSLSPSDQVTYAIQKISTEQDPELLRTALEDILKFSSTPEENQTSLQQVETALAKLPGEGADFQKVTLYKAKVLRRLGREEGDALFARAYDEQWPQYQYEYEQSLFETNNLTDAALLEFDRASGRLNGNLYQVPPYEEGVEDLGRFKLFLNRIQSKNPDTAIVYEIIEQLDSREEPYLLKELAKALCYSEYGLYEPAKNMIAQVETDRERHAETPGWKDLPLYKSMILMDEGKDLPAAQTEFRNYMAAREGHYKLIYSAGDRYIESLQYPKEDYAKRDEIALLLIESPITREEAVKQTFSDYELAHLYDVYHQGVAWSGDLDKSAEICKYVYATYFPSLPAANCALNYALYLSWHDGGDLDAAMDILNTIAAQAPYDTLMPNVRVIQAEILLKKGEITQAYNYVQEAITRCNAFNDGRLQASLKNALELRERIEGKK